MVTGICCNSIIPWHHSTNRKKSPRQCFFCFMMGCTGGTPSIRWKLQHGLVAPWTVKASCQNQMHVLHCTTVIMRAITVTLLLRALETSAAYFEVHWLALICGDESASNKLIGDIKSTLSTTINELRSVRTFETHLSINLGQFVRYEKTQKCTAAFELETFRTSIVDWRWDW